MSMEIDALINQIYSDKMNSICFDCGNENPVFVSINNGIFLCDQCATVHMSFPQGISIIENNDLYALSENDLKFLALGGNTRLNDFILDEFPKLENYAQKLLYKTRGLDYYRKRLYYYVNGGVEPRRPSQIVGCQLIPDNYYSHNNYIKKNEKKIEPKTRTYKPEEHLKSRKFNINQRNNENDNDEEEDFFRDPFMNESKFGMNEGNMFKKFFGNDLFGDDDFFGFGGDKLNQTQRFDQPPFFQEKPKPKQTYEHKIIHGPQDNLSKSTNPSYHQKANPRPLTASHPIFVPSRKHKYVKRNLNNDYNTQTEPRRGNINNYDNIDEKDKYNPFKRRDSTDLITIPGSENKDSTKNKRQQKTHEIPLEFHKQASGLGQIADTVNEKDEDSLNEIDEKMENENEDSSDELDRIAAESNYNYRTTTNPKDIYDEDKITFKNSIRNKYKKKKSEQIMDDIKKQEEKLKNSKPNHNIYESKYNNKENNNINKKPSRKSKEFKSKNNIDDTNPSSYKKYARKLSKMNISSTNWNINQLGDINTYPDAMEVEE
jgi:ADP-ribosylation factor GTPase-activating protein 2/3